MMALSRKPALSILITFVLSLAAMSAHATTHDNVEVVDCEFCSTYSDPHDVPSVADSVIVSPIVAQTCDGRVVHVAETQAVRSYDTRGPPI